VTDPVDKRRYHRFLALLEVRVVPGEGIPTDLKLATIDIAVGGARCASNRPLNEDTRLQLTLNLVGGDLSQALTVEAEAVVLRCTVNPSAPEPRRYEVALRFERIDPAERDRLRNYLNTL
jgi:c-di-GMP-binding flagellar brake protein YcgR